MREAGLSRWRRFGTGSLLPVLWLAALTVPSAVPSPASSPDVASPDVAVTVPHRVPAPAPSTSQPFPGPAAGALQIVSVVAARASDTTARLTRWERAAVGLPWRRVGAPISVRLGAAGLSRHPREGRAKTPIGTFTLTRAFGRDANRGHRLTRLPYHRWRPGDGWNTSPGPAYNRLGRGGELYMARDTWARLAVLIDYNVVHPRRGAGSGFFLHVSTGAPTHGCVGLPRPEMLRLVRWLDPNAQPRVVIAVRR